MNNKFCEYGVIFTSYSCGDFSEQPVFYATLSIWLLWGFLAFCLSLYRLLSYAKNDNSYLTVYGDPDSLTNILKKVHLHFSELGESLELAEKVQDDETHM